ncbi:MAG: hypothetical protein ABSE82_17355 [Nitrososphaerales archaeon]
MIALKVFTRVHVVINGKGKSALTLSTNSLPIAQTKELGGIRSCMIRLLSLDVAAPLRLDVYIGIKNFGSIRTAVSSLPKFEEMPKQFSINAAFGITSHKKTERKTICGQIH